MSLERQVSRLSENPTILLQLLPQCRLSDRRKRIPWLAIPNAPRYVGCRMFRLLEPDGFPFAPLEGNPERTKKLKYADSKYSLAHALAKIKMDNALSGNNITLTAKPTLHEFSILNAFADFLLSLVGEKSILMGLLMNLWLECDSSLVADIFNEKNFVPWRLRNLWSQCSGIMRLMNIRCSHIFREDNHCADKFATVGVLSKSDLWWNDTIVFLLNDFNRNRLSFPNYRLKHF
ncbi:hypothetical protein Lal_00041733 [Lupinus albus]|nr:hypothetical protein Lal_00041733 [Lupinus albus]